MFNRTNLKPRKNSSILYQVPVEDKGYWKV